MMRHINSFILIFLLSLGLPVQAESIFKTITLQHRFANDLLPTINPMVGEGGTASGIRNQLILRASPERMRDIEAVIQQLDITRPNHHITINRSGNHDMQADRTGVNGNVRIGNVNIGNDRRIRRHGGNIIIERNRRHVQSNSSQFLNVLDGERAFISVGQIVPFTQEWATVTRRYIHIDRTTGWRDISTGFAVRPRTIGNLVELEVTPRIASLNNQGYIDFEALSSTFRVSLGEWVDIGGFMQNHDDVSRQILGRQNSTAYQHTNLMVRVD